MAMAATSLGWQQALHTATDRIGATLPEPV